MKNFSLFVFAIILLSCGGEDLATVSQDTSSVDSLELTKMIAIREQAMIDKDMGNAMAQFTDDVTWINSQGYYFEGKSEVNKFHDMLASNDTLDYFYEAGVPKIRIVDANNAIAYYSWKMFWYKKENPIDTTKKEIGLMTLTAKKESESWKWIAVTNQYTPWFYEEIEPVRIE